MNSNNNSNAAAVEITMLGRRDRLMRDIMAGGFKLKHTAILCDRSAPKFPENAQLKRSYNRVFLMESLRTARPLTHVSSDNIRDRSAPRIDKHTVIKFVERRYFLDNVLQGAENFYNRLLGSLKSSKQNLAASTHSLANALKTSTQNLACSLRDTLMVAADSVSISTRHSLLKDIEANRAQLKHVPSQSIRDKSKPFLPSPYALEQTRKNEALARCNNSRTLFLSEIKFRAVCRSLNHVATCDKSAPAIAASKYNLHQWDRKALLAEVKKPAAHDLHPVRDVHDASVPVLPSGPINLHKDTRKNLLCEVKEGVELAHPSAIRDRSAARISM